MISKLNMLLGSGKDNVKVNALSENLVLENFENKEDVSKEVNI